MLPPTLDPEYLVERMSYMNTGTLGDTFKLGPLDSSDEAYDRLKKYVIGKMNGPTSFVYHTGDDNAVAATLRTQKLDNQGTRKFDEALCVKGDHRLHVRTQITFADDQARPMDLNVYIARVNKKRGDPNLGYRLHIIRSASMADVHTDIAAYAVVAWLLPEHFACRLTREETAVENCTIWSAIFFSKQLWRLVWEAVQSMSLSSSASKKKKTTTAATTSSSSSAKKKKRSTTSAATATSSKKKRSRNDDDDYEEEDDEDDDDYDDNEAEDYEEDGAARGGKRTAGASISFMSIGGYKVYNTLCTQGYKGSGVDRYRQVLRNELIPLLQSLIEMVVLGGANNDVLKLGSEGPRAEYYSQTRAPRRKVAHEFFGGGDVVVVKKGSGKRKKRGSPVASSSASLDEAPAVVSSPQAVDVAPRAQKRACRNGDGVGTVIVAGVDSLCVSSPMKKITNNNNNNNNDDDDGGGGGDGSKATKAQEVTVVAGLFDDITVEQEEDLLCHARKSSTNSSSGSDEKTWEKMKKTITTVNINNNNSVDADVVELCFADRTLTETSEASTVINEDGPRGSGSNSIFNVDMFLATDPCSSSSYTSSSPTSLGAGEAADEMMMMDTPPSVTRCALKRFEHDGGFQLWDNGSQQSSEFGGNNDDEDEGDGGWSLYVGQ